MTQFTQSFEQKLTCSTVVMSDSNNSLRTGRQITFNTFVQDGLLKSNLRVYEHTNRATQGNSLKPIIRLETNDLSQAIMCYNGLADPEHLPSEAHALLYIDGAIS